jgi:3-isopropylmalate/(R)-2-methylmalate dehydratase large subunit
MNIFELIKAGDAEGLKELLAASPEVVREADENGVSQEALEAGLRVADGVKFFIQFGSQAVEKFARDNGLVDTFEKAGAVVLNPGCGACIGCGPGVSDTTDEVTVSAINRNFKGRSGPGKLWLASPLTVAASAFTGKLTPYTRGMFQKELTTSS